jgi:hypothetical protein
MSPKQTGTFRIIIPGGSSTNHDMWEYGIDRLLDAVAPTRVISFLSEEWLGYRAWVQNLSLDMSKDGGCSVVACTQSIISIADQGFERASNAHWGPHAEENLLLNSSNARRKDIQVRLKNGVLETVHEVSLEISCILVGLEPCFGNRYPGHGCRDFFAGGGRLFKPRVGQDTTRILGRFVPSQHQAVTPIFCFKLQVCGQTSLQGLPNPISGIQSTGRKDDLTRLKMKKNASDGIGGEWRSAVFTMYGPCYGVNPWFPEVMPQRAVMDAYLTKKDHIVMSGMVVPALARGMPTRYVLDTVNKGFGEKSIFDMMEASGSEFPIQLREYQLKGLTEDQDTFQMLNDQLETELQWTHDPSNEGAMSRQRPPEVQALLKQRMQESETLMGNYEDLQQWEQEKPDEVHKAAVDALIYLCGNTSWKIEQKSEGITENDQRIQWWQDVESLKRKIEQEDQVKEMMGMEDTER